MNKRCLAYQQCGELHRIWPDQSCGRFSDYWTRLVSAEYDLGQIVWAIQEPADRIRIR